MDKTDIKSLLPGELEIFLKELGQPKFRAAQIFKWLHSGVRNFDEMSNIPKTLREMLRERCYIADVEIARRLESKIDSTVKYLYKLHDGEYIESVLMKYHHGYTVCISTQVGCRMGCSFCASGINGLCRNLTASEMISQLLAAQRDNGIRVSNVVMMGMGEPLDNFEQSVKFLKLVSDENGMNIGLRHISLSTSGVVLGIEKLALYGFPITLSVSLHAPSDEIRNTIMPINKKWNVEALIDACRKYQNATGRRISFEYALMKGINDTDECAELLAKKLKGIMCHINLIPANPVEETQFSKPDRKHIVNFCELLNKKGLNSTIRRTLGADIDASCGQLRRKSLKEGCDNL